MKELRGPRTNIRDVMIGKLDTYTVFMNDPPKE